MTGDFTQVEQKMAWAHHQLTLLNQEVTEYLNREPYVTFIEDKPERQGFQVTARLHEAPPVKVALLAGDFLNCAHGALDYLAWQLVIREGEVPGSKTAFPIHIPNEDGTFPVIQIADRRNRPAIKDQAVLDALEAVQPYHDGQNARGHPLHILKVLNRETKHRHLPLLAATIGGFAVGGGYTTLTDQVAVFSAKRSKDEEEVKFVPYDQHPNPRMPQQYKIAAHVSIERVGEPELDLLETLIAIYDRIGTDFPFRFRPLFV